jgi:hypothetical protein
VLRATHLAVSLGVFVDAKNDRLVAYYEARGFVRLDDRPRHLFMPIGRLHALFPEVASSLPSSADLLDRVAVNQSFAQLATGG